MSTEKLRKAVDDLRAACGDGSFEMSAVQTADVLKVLEALRDQEAEVARLNAAWDSAYKQAMQNGESTQVQRDRAERAEALLREKGVTATDFATAMHNLGLSVATYARVDHEARRIARERAATQEGEG